MNIAKSAGLVLCVLLIAGCAGTQAAKTEVIPVAGTEWILLEIRTPERSVVLDRTKLDADAYSLNFEGEQLAFGKAAANRYRVPCEWGDDNTLGIGPAAATLMAVLDEPQLKEGEFFSCLGLVRRYDIIDGRLELYIDPDAMRKHSVMVFARR